MKLQPFEQDGQIVGYMFQCPGCNDHHALHVRPNKAPNGASWEFSGDMEKPSFSPSIVSKVESPSGKLMVCHFFLVNGRLRYLSDSTHTLASQTVDLPDFDALEKAS